MSFRNLGIHRVSVLAPIMESQMEKHGEKGMETERTEGSG